VKKIILFISIFTFCIAIYFKTAYNHGSSIRSSTISPEIVNVNPTPHQIQSKVYQQIESKRKVTSDQPKERPLDNDSQKKFNAAMSLYGKDNAKVKALLKEAIDLDSGNISALSLLSGIYLNEDKKLEARELAIDCLAIDIKNKDCHETLISSFTRYGEFDESYRYLSDCLSENPDNIACLGGLETYYLHAGRLQDAKDILDHLQKISPDSIWTDIAAGGYYESSGDLEQAKTYYERACKKGQSFACTQAKKIGH